MARRMRGGPLVMLVLLVGGWSAARAWWWEYPFAVAAVSAYPVAAAGPRPPPHRARPAPFADAAVPMLAVNHEAAASARAGPIPRAVAAGRGPGGGRPGITRTAGLPGAPGAPPQLATAPPQGGRGAPVSSALPTLLLAPALPAPLAPPRADGPKRWSLDGWAFWRQGSGAAPVSQGRVPIYGASQAGAVLQYRLAPSSRRDPRLYARAYRALVRRGESELALGASLRPMPRVPLRLAGEVRYTDAAFSDTFRPAAYAVTELAPMRLPLATTLEIYAQGGWVGGPGETPFADGQASLTRSLPAVARLTDERLRLSLGAGAWGGAQRDAQRLDLGPTMRLDLRIGKVPARVSVDWRLRVAGDAAPGSGVAATVSTGF
jgi:hypothetical protein